MIYLDNSATTYPKPEIVYKRMIEDYRKYGVNPHRGDYRASLKASSIVEETRSKIARFFNAPSHQHVIFTFNATDALNIAIRGVLEEGDEVITTVMEHNSVLRPLNYLSIEKNIRITYLEPEGEKINIERLKASLTEKTKLTIINHVSNVTGYTQDIEEIGNIIKKYSSSLLLVDAAQSAGIIPIDMEKSKIDILATTGHKALYGPTGIGILILRPGIKIKPLRAGGSGHSSEKPLQPETFPELLEAGTLNLLGILGLKYGIEFLEEMGLENIHKKESELKEILLENIRKNEKIKIFTSVEKISPAIISITHREYSPVELANILDSEFDIALRAGLHCAPLIHKFLGTYPAGTLRISIGFFNTEEEIYTLSEALNTL